MAAGFRVREFGHWVPSPGTPLGNHCVMNLTFLTGLGTTWPNFYAWRSIRKLTLSLTKAEAAA